MEDQADTAVDPLEKAINLIANSEDESDPQDEEQEEGTEEAEEDESEAEEEASEPAKVQVLVAGQPVDLPEGTPPEVAEKVQEIGKSLQADYTRKSQELSSREKQAAEQVQKELSEGRQHIQKSIQQAHAVIRAVGGLMDPTELAQLASADPQAWIQANARQQQLMNYLGQLDQQGKQLAEQEQKAQAERLETAKSQAWQRLGEEGIDHDALQKLWNGAKHHFGLSDAQLSNVLDADSWIVLRDAIAFRELKAAKPAVTKKAAEAPKVPEAKRPMSKDDRARLDARKAVQRRGGASMRDLAAFLETNRK